MWEIWGALLHGARLVVVPDAETRSPRDFHPAAGLRGGHGADPDALGRRGLSTDGLDGVAALVIGAEACPAETVTAGRRAG